MYNCVEQSVTLTGILFVWGKVFVGERFRRFAAVVGTGQYSSSDTVNAHFVILCQLSVRFHFRLS